MEKNEKKGISNNEKSIEGRFQETENTVKTDT